jgi:hypothetical protein
VTFPPDLAWRGGIVAVSLVLWFGTQALLARRAFPASGAIRDRLHDWTAPLHARLVARPRAADGVLLVSSLVVDLLGLLLLGAGLLGPSFRPFLALALLFALRQVCQALCALPAPPGMIWRDPGFPTLLVTYRTSNDFFFSGHTAIAVLGALEVAGLGPPWLAVAVALVAVAEAAVVIVLRAHWTLDVVAAALAALACDALAAAAAPAVDAWLRG